MTRIKICGLTNREDIDAAIQFGADALGFIGVEESPRYVTPELFREITQNLPVFVPRVVIVKKPSQAAAYQPEYIQYYQEDTDWQQGPGNTKLIRCLRMSGTESLDEIAQLPHNISALLLDAFHKEKLGGSGETFNWELVTKVKEITDLPVILAGGLTPDNIVQAISTTNPYAVDIASGIEASPGKKDISKLKSFIQIIRQWDLNHQSQL